MLGASRPATRVVYVLLAIHATFTFLDVYRDIRIFELRGLLAIIVHTYNNQFLSLCEFALSIFRLPRDAVQVFASTVSIYLFVFTNIALATHRAKVNKESEMRKHLRLPVDYNRYARILAIAIYTIPPSYALISWKFFPFSLDDHMAWPAIIFAVFAAYISYFVSVRPLLNIGRILMSAVIVSQVSGLELQTHVTLAVLVLLLFIFNLLAFQLDSSFEVRDRKDWS